MTNFIQEFVLHAWRRRSTFFYFVLIPLSWLFTVITALRRFAYQLGLLKSYALPVPVIIVGNIKMGGTGKTPVVIWLVEQLRKNGYQPAVISRGYGSSAILPISVSANSLASVVGDEPLLIANRCNCPIWVGADRVHAATELLKAHPECNVIISDDGLQHYRLKRDFEIAVVEANMPPVGAYLLPAGPLREPLTRLQTVDAIICNGEEVITSAFQMRLIGEQFYNLADANLTATVADFKRKTVTAIAGIGNPERFFEHLRKLGITFAGIAFTDHYAFTAQDLARIDCDAIIMTEKDAVKCKAFAKPNCWVLPVQASIDEGLMEKVLNKLQHKLQK